MEVKEGVQGERSWHREGSATGNWGKEGEVGVKKDEHINPYIIVLYTLLSLFHPHPRARRFWAFFVHLCVRGVKEGKKSRNAQNYSLQAIIKPPYMATLGVGQIPGDPTGCTSSPALAVLTLGSPIPRAWHPEHDAGDLAPAKPVPNTIEPFADHNPIVTPGGLRARERHGVDLKRSCDCRLRVVLPDGPAPGVPATRCLRSRPKATPTRLYRRDAWRQ